MAFLYEHCSRGSLEDIFSNPELELDWVFRLSFALDAAEGMMYLHNKRIIHGRVSTATCIVNEQWTLKLKGIDKRLEYWCMHESHSFHNYTILYTYYVDYGLRQLHKPMFNSAKKEGDREVSQLYRVINRCMLTIMIYLSHVIMSKFMCALRTMNGPYAKLLTSRGLIASIMLCSILEPIPNFLLAKIKFKYFHSPYISIMTHAWVICNLLIQSLLGKSTFEHA